MRQMEKPRPEKYAEQNPNKPYKKNKQAQKLPIAEEGWIRHLQPKYKTLWHCWNKPYKKLNKSWKKNGAKKKIVLKMFMVARD